ncbi:MAG: alpha-galactosidase [Armatimonadota bacterium]
MKKIAFIGAGSFGFTRDLVRDILTFPALCDCEIALMDIDEERLSFIKTAVDRIIAAGNYPAKVTATLNRAEALKDADGVVITILQGGVQVFRHDVEIPMKYGVNINIGDTRGPSGIFRFLRTAPVMLDIILDVERYCPDAIVLNYTNPMAMLCRTMQTKSKAKVTGLCHSVQGDALMLAKWIGAPMEEITYFCAGINHQAWYLKFEWNGKDAYPLIRKAIENKREIYDIEIVKNDMFFHLGYYGTESSGHVSEYVPWYRKRADLLDKFCNMKDSWNPGGYAFIVNHYLHKENCWRDDIKFELEQPIDLNRGLEYASSIFNATIGDGQLFEFNGNVRNFGLIDNLPEGCCVEVPVIASKRGIDPLKVGKLPPQLALLNSHTAQTEELAVEAFLDSDPSKIYYACYYDPLTSAVLTLSEIKSMVREMFEANKDYLSNFKHFD